MKVSKLTVKQTLGLNFVMRDLGDVVKVVGGNGAGKSRALTVLMGALGVKSLTADQKAMLRDCDGVVEVELSGGWKAKMVCQAGLNPVIKVTGPGGKLVNKGVLSEFIGKNFVNISSFIGMDSGKRDDLILKVFGVKDEVEDTKGKIAALTSKRVEIFRRRKLYEVEPVEQVEQVDSAKTLNDIRHLEVKISELGNLEKEINEKREKVYGNKVEIKRLLQLIEALKSHNENLNGEISSLVKVYDSEKDNELESKLLTLTDNLRKAETVNKQAYEYQQYLKNVDKYNEADELYKQASDKVDVERGKLGKLLAKVDLPVEGLVFDPDKGLLHDGQSVWSDGEKRAIALKLAKALKGDLGVAVFENFSLMDKVNQDKLLKECEQAGFQVFVELVQSENVENDNVYFIKDGNLSE